MCICLDGETINEDGDAYRKLNKEQLLFPLNHLFRKIELNEMCTAITPCNVIGIPKDMLEYLCKIMTTYLLHCSKS